MHFNPQIEQLILDAGKFVGQSRWAQALHALDKVRTVDPQYVSGNAEIQFLAATCLSSMGRYETAEKAFIKTIKLLPSHTNARVGLAALYSQIHEDSKSIEHLRIAVERDPDNLYAVCQLSAWYMDQGDAETAEKILAPLVTLVRAGAISNPGPAIVFARIALATRKEQEGFDLLERFSHNQDMQKPNQRLVLRWLGDLCDRMGRYDDAFGYFGRAQQVEIKPYDPDENSARVDALIKAWTPEVARAVYRAEPVADTPRVVFVLGMARSGTSLVERIIGSHPDACACGELQGMRRIAAHIDPAHMSHRPLPIDIGSMTPELMTNAAKSYIRHIKEFQKRLGSTEESLLTDKNPYNFHYIPMIASMFPGSAIVHTTRDPADTCLSNYFQFFQGGQRHTSDLYNLGRYYRDYERLMQHWRLLAADFGIRILDVSYQSLLEDQEAWSRKIIEHVGLEWNDACLRFHEVKRAARTASNDQVRRPIYKSSLDRHENYKNHIGPLIAGLDGQGRP